MLSVELNGSGKQCSAFILFNPEMKASVHGAQEAMLAHGLVFMWQQVRDEIPVTPSHYGEIQEKRT
jgi:hypothetical protein